MCKEMCSSKAWMVVIQNLFLLKEIGQMEREMCLYTPLHSKELIRRVLRPSDRTVLRWAINGVINRREVRKEMSHSLNELVWALLPNPILCCVCASPQSGETRSADVIGCFKKRPNDDKRLADKQALVALSTKVEKGRRVVKTYDEDAEDTYAPNVSTVFGLRTSTLTTPSVPSTHAGSHLQSSDEAMLPVGAMQKRCGLDVVCETPIASDKLHLPGMETARRQSVPVGRLAGITEGKWLASIAA
ncbi:hypothetical protein AX14_008390, partial [Amanita brunnescens Koide BX004]